MIKMWYIDMVRLYLVIKKNDIMKISGKCMELKNKIVRGGGGNKRKLRRTNAASFSSCEELSF